MPSIYTIEGARGRRRKDSAAAACKFVGSGRRKRCLCRARNGRWKFQKNASRRCG